MSDERLRRLREAVRRMAWMVRSARLRSVKPRVGNPEEIAETIRRCLPRRGVIYLYWVKRGFKPPKIGSGSAQPHDRQGRGT